MGDTAKQLSGFSRRPLDMACSAWDPWFQCCRSCCRLRRSWRCSGQTACLGGLLCRTPCRGVGDTGPKSRAGAARHTMWALKAGSRREFRLKPSLAKLGQAASGLREVGLLDKRRCESPKSLRAHHRAMRAHFRAKFRTALPWPTFCGIEHPKQAPPPQPHPSKTLTGGRPSILSDMASPIFDAYEACLLRPNFAVLAPTRATTSKAACSPGFEAGGGELPPRYPKACNPAH